jgi:hypothetical protein
MKKKIRKFIKNYGQIIIMTIQIFIEIYKVTQIIDFKSDEKLLHNCNIKIMTNDSTNYKKK